MKQNNENILGSTGDEIKNQHCFINENNVKEITLKDNFYMNETRKVDFNEHKEVTNYKIAVNHLDTATIKNR